MFTKKQKTVLRNLGTALLLFSVVFLFAPKLVNADNPCSIWGDFDIVSCLLFGIMGLLAGFTTIAGVVLRGAGGIFDFALAISISGSAYDSTVAVVNIGWPIARDVATIFLTFILLIIAIGIILRLEQFGSKRLLIRLILIGLLVNFSLSFARVVIDASNVLALTFYNAMEAGDTATTIEAASGSTLLPGKPKGIAEVFVTGLDPGQALRTGKVASGALGIDKIVKNKEGDPLRKAILNGILAYTGAIAVMLVAAFILVALGILFFIRMVVLWILMILAPFAFVAMILPATAGYASTWWRKLFEQSFFAPAALFFFYVVAATIQNDFVKEAFGTTGSDLDGFLTPTGESMLMANGRVAAQYAVLIILLIATIVVSKQLGSYGAAGAMSAGNKMRKSTQNWAGRKANRYMAAPLARGVAKIPGVRSLPLVNTAVQGSLAKAEEDRARKGKAEERRFRNMPVHELAKAMPTLSAEGAARTFNRLKPQEQKELIRRMSKTPGGTAKVDAMARKVERAERQKILGGKGQAQYRGTGENIRKTFNEVASERHETQAEQYKQRALDSKTIDKGEKYTKKYEQEKRRAEKARARKTTPVMPTMTEGERADYTAMRKKPSRTTTDLEQKVRDLEDEIEDLKNRQS